MAVDYFAIGVIGYECMNGRRPYLGRSRREIREQVMARQVYIKRYEIPEGWTNEAADFINRCIKRWPAERLGIGGNKEVKEHPWFKDFPWRDLQDRKLVSPFIPSVRPLPKLSF